jgi:hypothetical protein
MTVELSHPKRIALDRRLAQAALRGRLLKFLYQAHVIMPTRLVELTVSRLGGRCLVFGGGFQDCIELPARFAVVIVAVLAAVFHGISDDERMRVAWLRHDVHTYHGKASAGVSRACAALTAKEVEET